MQKFTGVAVILSLLLTAAVVGIGLRYECVGTNASDLIVFDRLKGSFIQKNIKGEWEEKGVKKGEILIEFPSDKKPTGTSPAISPETKPAQQKPEIKI